MPWLWWTPQGLAGRRRDGVFLLAPGPGCWVWQSPPQKWWVP